MKYQHRYSDETLDEMDAWVDVANLTNGTSYNIEVRAVTAAGDGAAATATGAPVAPTE